MQSSKTQMKISQKQTVGVSKFVRRQKKGSGKTFSSLSFNKLAEYAEKELNNNNFKQGYRDGATNVKMYYSMKSELPPIEWIKNNRGNLLDTREKLLASLNK